MAMPCASSLGATDFAVNFKAVYLPDAIRYLARFLHANVIISPAVNGTATLDIQNTVSWDVFNLLLSSHGLAKWQYGNVFYIAPRDELIKRKQEELKWQEATADAEPLVTEVRQIRYAKAEEISHFLSGSTTLLSRRGQVHVDARTNVLCIQDVRERIENLRKIIKKLDVPIRQILIETRLTNVDSDFERELGIHFGIKTGSNQNNPGHYSIAVAKLADGSELDVKLDALENAGHADLISNPRLFTANQQTAFIEAGEEVPYQEVSESGGTAVTFKKAVLGLKVTPQVLPENKVLLQLQINQDRPGARMIQGVPTISTRQIVTNVLVKNGETIVLGGIYETNKENGEQRLPFLSSLPIIGMLFKTQHVRENKRELLIFVTPRIIT